MKDLLTLTESSSYEELYNKIKTCDPYAKDTNKHIFTMALHFQSSPSSSSLSYKTPIQGSMGMKSIAQNSVSFDTEKKLACTLINPGLQVDAVKFVDPSDSAKDIIKTLLEDRTWANLVISSPVQNLSKETLKTIEEVTKKIGLFDRKCLDVIAVGDNGCVSLAEEERMIDISGATDAFSRLTPCTAYKSELKEYYYRPKREGLHDAKGFHEYVDYHVQREIVGLNYANDREQINRLLAAKLNTRCNEEALSLTLDKQGNVTDLHTLAKGTINKAVIFSMRILESLEANPDNQYCVLVHNHPSGDTRPSVEDFSFTEDTLQALEIFDYTLLEHTIIGRETGIGHISDRNIRLEQNLKDFDEKFLEKEPEMTM